MVLTREDIDSFRQRFEAVRQQGEQYFEEVDPKKVVDEKYFPPHQSWVVEDGAMVEKANTLRERIKELSVEIAGAARGSPMFDEADMQELRQSMRQMLANLRFRKYRHFGVHIHHDQDVVLGVDPPSSEEVLFDKAAAARKSFDESGASILDLVGLLSPTNIAQPSYAESSNYRRNTAFIMMAIDHAEPELEDIKNCIKDVFREFGIVSVTADEIEHEEAITDRILEEIDTSEFLVADLTHERPNVYYEIGHAHARGKRVILYRKKGTDLHVDIAHRNCPEYENATALKVLLRRRLEAITNKLGPASLH